VADADEGVVDQRHRSAGTRDPDRRGVVETGPASIPPQYSGAGDQKYCGLIAIWTK